MSNDIAGGIPCPKCGNQSSSVVDSRTLASTSATRRRRQCACGHRFTTYETLADGAERQHGHTRTQARPSVLKRTRSNGVVFYVAQVRGSGRARTYIGSFHDKEEALTACRNFIDNGTKPPPQKRGPKGARSKPATAERPALKAKEDRLAMIARIARSLQ